MKKKKALIPKEQLAKKKQRKKIIKISLITAAVFVASVTVYMGVLVFQQVSGFSKEKLLSNESSVQIAQNTDQEYYAYGSSGARKNVSYEDIPQVMIDAVVSAEDSRFFEHNGFDLPRIVKALLGNIAAGGVTGGGSTITQQVIKKSYYPKEEQTIQRKIGEVILSIEASSQVTKEEVLELYLNKIYFGYGNKAIGIYAASRYYFDKSVQELTLPEAALLAGTLNSPNKFDPFRDLDLAQKRRDTILNLMRDHGYITEEECESTKSIPVENTLKSNPISSSGMYQAYADMVTREVIEKTGLDPETTSMRIYTYMNPTLQEKLNDISTGESFTFPDKYLQMGAVVQESTTGRVTGVIAARDYEPLGTSYAYAADKELNSTNIKKGEYKYNYGQRNQPGSSLKPLISYAAAFEFLNYSTAHYVHDIPVSLGNGHYPQNWDGKYHGDISITDALASSWNCAAIQTLQEVIDKVGSEKVINYLTGLGFDMYGEQFASGFAIGSWTTGISAQEQANAYSTIANGGTRIESHTVEKIEIISTGEVIELDEKYQSEKTQALSAESAFMIREVMLDYTKKGSSGYSYLKNIGVDVAAKSGTSNYDSSTKYKKLVGENKDLWLAAFSSDYSWSVWCGYASDEAQEKGYHPTGYTNYKLAALIGKYAHETKLNNTFPSQPDGVVKATCVSGLYPYVTPGDGVPSNRIVSGWFKKGSTPSGSASGSSVNSLTEFSASLVENKIAVNFTAYDPISMTESATPTKTYTVGKITKTLPYLGDPKQIYGKVVYVVEVADASGTIVHTEKLSTNTATLNYAPVAGTYTITGYYAYENGGSSSNKISSTVTVEAAQPTAVASFTTAASTATSITLKVVVPTGSSVTITCSNGASQKATASGNLVFEGLTINTPYTFTGLELTSTGATNQLVTQTINTAAQ